LDVFLFSRIMGEIRDLVKNPFDGVRYTENDEDTVSEIHAVIDGPGEYQRTIS
jgi:ubiquitin-protein ligase